MARAQFTREVLDAEIPKLEEQFLWAVGNMKKCSHGTDHKKEWFSLMIHLGQQVNALRIEAIDAVSENWD